MDCPFCEKSNPPDARFCNACGAQLNLVPCPRCGAVNESGANACFQCNTRLTDNAVDTETVTSSSVAAAPAHAKRASAEHRFEVMELMEAAAPDDATALRRTFRWPARRSSVAGLLVVLLAVLVGSVYLSKRQFSVGDSAATSVSDAAYATRPIRSGSAVDANEPVKSQPASPARNQTGPTASCTQGVAALGLCTPAPENAGRDERTQQATTVQ